MSNAPDIARRLARALDAQDYAQAASMLGERCEYMCRGRVYRGPSEIVDAYRSVGDSAHREFADIEYESHVEPIENYIARMHFLDHLRHANRAFTFRCQQIVEVDEHGRIVRIEHVDLPGQREALIAFMQGLRDSQSDVE